MSEHKFMGIHQTAVGIFQSSIFRSRGQTYLLELLANYNLALRAMGIESVSNNVVTWKNMHCPLDISEEVV